MGVVLGGKAGVVKKFRVLRAQSYLIHPFTGASSYATAKILLILIKEALLETVGAFDLNCPSPTAITGYYPIWSGTNVRSFKTDVDADI